MKVGLGGGILAALVAVIAAGAFWDIRDGSAQQQVLSPPAEIVPLDVTAAPIADAEVKLSFAPVVRRAAPAVVSIYTRTRISRPAEPIFEMLFGRRYGAPAREETSLGSGVIVRSDGVVLTNAHVIDGADEVTVSLADRREYRASILLVDERTDLAVLQIEAQDLPTLDFRDSDTMEVGDLVLAIGNPFGVGQTVTSGIISARTRTTPDGGVFLQTDAAINPGNSGGALVDMSGRLVGINTMILSPSGGSNGIGFAIPADLATQAVDSAERGNATVARAWIGVEGQTVTQEIAESLSLPRPEGVILSALHPRSSLREAGLRSGDIVLTVGGQPVGDETELAYRLGTARIGESLPISYMHDGQRLETSVRLISAPEDPPRNISELDGNHPLDGAVIANINPALAQESNLDPTQQGVVVMGLRRGYAARFGFRSGDILREVNGSRISRVDDVQRALTARSGPWDFIIERNGRLMHFAARGQKGGSREGRPPMNDLFEAAGLSRDAPRPLADRLRPQHLSEVIGQDHLLGPDAPLGRMTAARRLGSVILWGPPGVGKTTIARLLADATDLHFEQISAIFTGVAELRKVFEAAKGRRAVGQGTLLFVDEIHRFNRAQQDSFLPHMEEGTIVLVGATTENPSFELNAAVLSRAQVLVLKRLDAAALEALLQRAEGETGPLPLTPEAREALIAMADGDGRFLLNLAEDLAAEAPAEPLDQEGLSRILARRAPIYDKGREGHYNLISALHKSVRGSDPDAALYWLARMISAGEDPLYIARRVVRMAVEDIGMADPAALTQALGAKEAFDFLGSPEGELALAQAVVYVATAPKSNAAYVAWKAALAAAKDTGSLDPPAHILNAPTRLMKELGYGAGYAYDHDAPQAFSGANYFPDGMARQDFYQPVERGFEARISERMAHWRRLRQERGGKGS